MLSIFLWFTLFAEAWSILATHLPPYFHEVPYLELGGADLPFFFLIFILLYLVNSVDP